MAWVKVTGHECLSEKVHMMAREGKFRKGSVWECDLKTCGRRWTLADWELNGGRKIPVWELNEDVDLDSAS